MFGGGWLRLPTQTARHWNAHDSSVIISQRWITPLTHVPSGIHRNPKIAIATDTDIHSFLQLLLLTITYIRSLTHPLTHVHYSTIKLIPLRIPISGVPDLREPSWVLGLLVKKEENRPGWE